MSKRLECVWIGDVTKKFPINASENSFLNVFGIYIDNEGCSEKNWREK